VALADALRREGAARLASRLARRPGIFCATFLTGFLAAFRAALDFTLRTGFFGFATDFLLAFLAMVFPNGMNLGAI
jgi:hypothetical protein